MKIFPINNILNINKNHNHKPSFKARWIEDANSYDRVDSYIDETGMHYVKNRVPYPWNEPWDEQINDSFDKRPLPRNPQKIKENVFLTQRQFDAKGGDSYVWEEKKLIEKALFDLDFERVNTLVRCLSDIKMQKITGQPFFALGLADIPMTEENKESYKNLLKYTIEHSLETVNIMDENGITLLEKVMNSENEPYLATIREICKKHNPSDENPAGIAYDPMQKYAFDNIQNPKFKEKCKSLPMFFPDILDDIKRKDLLSIDKHVHEQMTCGFCDIDYFIKAAHRLAVEYEDNLYGYYLTESDYKKSYSKMVLDVVKKHFPKEVEKHIKHIIL